MALKCGLEAVKVYEEKGIYNDDLIRIYNLIGSAALFLEQQGDKQVNIDGDSKSWFKKTLRLIGELYPEMYEENLNQLIANLPDVQEEYWTI